MGLVEPAGAVERGRQRGVRGQGRRRVEASGLGDRDPSPGLAHRLVVQAGAVEREREREVGVADPR